MFSCNGTMIFKDREANFIFRGLELTVSANLYNEEFGFEWGDIEVYYEVPSKGVSERLYDACYKQAVEALCDELEG